MGRSKRDVRAAAEESTTPPDQLTNSQSLAKVIKAEGNSLYSCLLPDQRPVLVELVARFRNTIWIKRGGFVLVDLISPKEQKGKIEGEIVNVVRDEKEWRKQGYWPKEFARSTYEEDEDEESTVGKMPPSDSESEV
ncbi:nucleic acid-binding protein [Xylariaceae sp. FL0016]|nr:nucleic acid-binding protein [Xylariaceae sp. FL0016]